MAAPVSICSGFEYSTRPEYRLYAVIATTGTSFTKCMEEPRYQRKQHSRHNNKYGNKRHSSSVTSDGYPLGSFAIPPCWTTKHPQKRIKQGYNFITASRKRQT